MESSDEMSDLSHLVHLEAYRRFKEEESHLRRMVEEKTKQYNEVKTEYLTLYNKFIEVLKLCANRDALLTENFQDHKNIPETMSSIKTITHKTNIDQQEEYLQGNVLEEAKSIISKTSEYKHLRGIHHSTANNKNSVDFIKSSLARVESKLQTSIVLGMDSFIKRIED